jgi:hypothetical protein
MAKFINVKKEGDSIGLVNVEYIMSITPSETGCTIVVYPGTGSDATIHLEITVAELMGRIGE